MAEDADHGDKTEQPTDRRRQEVRERGNVARSADLTTSVSVLAMASAFQFLGGDLVGSLGGLLRKSLSAPPWQEIDIPWLMAQLVELGSQLVQGLLPVLGVMLVSAVVVNLAQVGFLFTSESLQPDLNRLNPLSGLQRMFALQGTVRLAASLFKLAVLLVIVIGFVMGRLPQFLGTIDLSTVALFRQTGDWMIGLSFRLAVGLVTLAVLDYGFQLWKFEQDIKMTKQEIRDEMRHMEGDPQIRHRRREAHRKLVSARQVQRTKEADVIITNPTEIAIAIKYDPEKMDAPIVLAKGKGLLAARIRQMAAEHRIPIVEKKPLAQALYRTVKVGQPIPVDLYEAVAEILAYVYRLSNKKLKSA